MCFFFVYFFLKVSQDNYLNKIPISIFQAADGGSSTSESSLGSSSGYGSQSTVRPEDQHNLHQPTLTAVHDGIKTFSFSSFHFTVHMYSILCDLIAFLNWQVNSFMLFYVFLIPAFKKYVIWELHCQVLHLLGQKLNNNSIVLLLWKYSRDFWE